MNRFLLVACLLAFAASNVAAFSVTPSKALSTRLPQASASDASSPFDTTSTTAMNMVRVKIDPNQSDNERMNPAAFKNFAYLGSIGFAVLLPVVFLVWSSFQ